MRAGTAEITPVNLALRPEAMEERRALEKDFPDAGFYVDQFLAHTGGSPETFQPVEFRPYTFAIAKLSGSIAEDRDALGRFAADAASLQRMGLILDVMHGAGKQITAKLSAAGFRSETRPDGTRITPGEHMWAVYESLEEVNAAICEAIVKEGGVVEPVKDIFTAALSDPDDRGSVEQITKVDTGQIEEASLAGKIPVCRPDGHTVLPNGEVAATNINADIAGRALAAALKVLKYISLTDTPIVERGIPQRNLTAEKAAAMIDSGDIHGGAVVKVREGIELVRQGVHQVVIVQFDHFRNELYQPEGSANMGTNIHE